MQVGEIFCRHGGSHEAVKILKQVFLTRLPEREAIDGQASFEPLESSHLASEREQGCPEKNSCTSSVPPSRDRKAMRKGSKPGGAKAGHEGHSRKLCATPDIIQDHRPLHCDSCNGLLGSDALGHIIGEYDAIELPKVKPIITRHRRFCLCCPACGVKTPAPVPEAAQGTPFGPGIHALAIYLKSFQAVS